MADLRKLKQDLLANGKVEGHELEVLRKEIYAGGKIDRKKADLLVELHKQVERVTPAFEQFFYQAIKDHVLSNGPINAATTSWLRQMLFADGAIDDREKKFLRELKGEAKEAAPEFQALYDECFK